MPVTLVIFGASGDLTSRKLVPALYQLFRKGRLPADTRIVGFSRTPFTDDAWRESLGKSTRQFEPKQFDAAAWQKFATALHYQPGDLGSAADFEALSRPVRRSSDR